MFGENSKAFLITGGSGKLGRRIKKNYFFKNSFLPSSRELDITNKKKIFNFFFKYKFNIIIHCAALSNMEKCEINKKKAYKINVDGTKNLVEACKKFNKNLKFIFLSSDAVYPCKKGNYKENHKLKSYNYYGKTKILAEDKVKKLKKYLIIRTRFFNKKKLKYKDAAIDSYSSSIEVEKFIKILKKLIKKKISGIVNVGSSRISDFLLYKKFNKKIKKTSILKIQKKKKCIISIDASLNINKLKKILND